MNAKLAEELFHYGVLGMKWGIRRYQPYSKDYKGDGKFIGKKDKISRDDDVLIPKGVKAYRISKDKTESNSSYRYMTVDPNDRNFYKSMWGNTMKKDIGSVSKKDKIYEQTYKTTSDLISPSATKRSKIANNLMKRKDIQEEVAASRTVKDTVEATGWTSAQAKTAFSLARRHDTKHMSKENVDNINKRYKENLKNVKKELGTGFDDVSFFSSMGSSDYLKAEYGKAVVKKGYNMSIDDYGANFPGKNQRVNAPIIVYDVDKYVRQIGSKRVSDYSASLAGESYAYDMAYIPKRVSDEYLLPNLFKDKLGWEFY